MSDYLRSDHEWSWILRPLNGFIITPPVRNQGRRPSCVFQAFSAGTDMETRRVAALGNVPALSNLSVDTPSYIGDYERLIGRRLGEGGAFDYAPGRVWSAAHLILHRGVMAHEGQQDRPVRLDNVQAHGFLKFRKIMKFIKQGKPVIGGFTCNEELFSLPRGQIYTFRPSKWHTTIAHMVIFIGYGMRHRRPYLVFLNSSGEGFSENGFGRVWFKEVRDFHTVCIEGDTFDKEPKLTHGQRDSHSSRHGLRSAATASSSASRRYAYGDVTSASSSSHTSVDATSCDAGDFEFIMAEHK